VGKKSVYIGMRKVLIAVAIVTILSAAVIYLTSTPVKCDDCNQGNKCSTSFDCGEIGVCYCQYTFEEENGEGTCFFE